MAICAVYQGYTRDCRDAIGGIKTVYFTELGNKNTLTSASGLATAFTLNVGKQFFKYDLELGVGTADQTDTPNAPNGSFFVEQNLNITIPKHNASISYSMKTLAVTDLMAIVEKNDGTFWLMGQVNGMKMQPSKNPWGKALGDLNGYELVYKGMEPNEAIQIPANLIATLSAPAV